MAENSLPEYAELFGESRFVAGQDARAVTSPAAYFVELLGLLEGTFDRPGLLERRPDLKRIVLDEKNTFGETAYLDIVNEVLERLIGPDPYETLRTRVHPFGLPFSVRNERLRAHLDELKVTPEELYRLFAARVDHDIAAREYLGLSAEDVTVLTTEAVPEAELGGRYGLIAGENFDALLDARRFLEATGLDEAALRELVKLRTEVQLNPEETRLAAPAGPASLVAWLGRTHRLIRLTRRTGLTLTDADTVLTTFAAGRLDLPALRAVAGAVRLVRLHGMTVPDVCGLVLPWKPAEGVAVETATGDILTPANRDYRFRLAALIDVAEPDIVEIVRRHRQRYSGNEPGPFDGGRVELPEITLIRRCGLLARALGISAGELFDLLVAIEGDPSLQRYPAFAVLGEPGPQTRDLHAVLRGGPPQTVLWLAQTLFAIAGWMGRAGFDGAELAKILGGRPETDDSGRIALFKRLGEELDQVALEPSALVSDRFGERAAQVVHDVLVACHPGVVPSVGSRALELDAEAARGAAYRAVTDLGVIFASDLQGLGLGERLQHKIFRNLVFRGVLHADGALAAETTALGPAELAGDFSAHREAVFKAIGAVINGTAVFRPSDLAAFGELSDAARAELYDNLWYIGYIEEHGTLVEPDFFLDVENVAHFEVNADLADAAGPLGALFAERLAGFRDNALRLDPDILTELWLTPAQTTRLMESLHFNGHLDAEGRFTDQAALLTLPLADFGLAAEFAPIRAELLAILQARIAAHRAKLTTFGPDDFADLADGIAARRAFTAMDGVHLSGGRVLDPDEFADPEGTVQLGPGFLAPDQDAVFARIVRVLRDETPYRVDPAALTDLGLDEAGRDQVIAHLVKEGDLTPRLAVTRDRLGYFANPDNSLAFTLPGAPDHARKVFFLLHTVARALTAAVTELTDRLTVLAGRQNTALYSCLADVLGVPAAVAEAIAQCVAGGPAQARALLSVPALDLVEPPADAWVRLAVRRIRRFAALAAKLGLTPDEVRAVFADQDLTGKFPEPLTLPQGADRIDALLEGGDGLLYLFAGDGYWTYSAATHEPTGTGRRPLTDLSPRFAALTSIDAAFVRPGGVEWLVGRDAAGTSSVFTRDKAGTAWVPRAQTFGKVKSAFTDPARIDSAYTDTDGHTYLFAGDQYVRYSSGLATADEGYPRPVADWWRHEGLPGPVPATPLDACFQDRDGLVHVFTGGVEHTTAGTAPIAQGWGTTPAPAGLTGVDAAYTEGAAARLLAGGRWLGYSDSIENPGVLADEGTARPAGVPPQFETGVEAAFTAPDGVVHLFKDGRTVALTGPGATSVAVADRWGVLPAPLSGGIVDAAFTGLDGKTYLFSGATYLRYSTGDYSVADPGHPRSIAGDWGGLTKVEASFVLDGHTYLFGVGGHLFDLPADSRADLDAGRVTPRLRNLLAEHALTLREVRRNAGDWVLATEEGVTLTVRLEGLRLKASGDGSRFYVRYSTRDYRTPDAGFPKPLSDNWWNMPAHMELGPVDAVFTGRDGRTYLFSGDRFVRFDARHRWWSEPMALRERWDSIPFARIDAAFVGVDGRTYVFSGDRYVRYSTDDYTQVDDGYPEKISSLWGRVSNTLARTGKVDAAFVLDAVEKVDGVDRPRTSAYLFSGDQYVRYTCAGTAMPATVDPGYPRPLSVLRTEPGLAGLPAGFGRIDAAYSDRRTAYLFSGGRCHAVSGATYRRYDDLPVRDLTCAFIQDGTLVAATAAGWVRLSALEGRTVTATPFRPRVLRGVPDRFRTGLDSVLTGADGTTYLFQGATCFNTQLGRPYPAEQEWGRPRNNLYDTGAVDAAFVGRDGRTYLFSGDQFVVYAADGGTAIDGDPRPIADSWAGLTSVALAYVHGDRTYLFERPDAAGRRRYLVYSGTAYDTPDPGHPRLADAAFHQAPEGFPFPAAVLSDGDTLTLLAGESCVSRTGSGGWSRVRPIERLYPGFGHDLDAPDGLRSAFRAADGTIHFFFDDTFASLTGEVFGARTPVRDRWGRSPNPFLPPGAAVDAAFVWKGRYTYLFSGTRYVRYTGTTYRNIDPGYPKPIIGELRKEPPFGHLPDTFDAALTAPLDAVVGNDRTIHLISGGICHTVSPEPTGTIDLAGLGRTRDNLATSGRVDATLVAGGRTYLFSGDQYVRYSGTDRTRADDGYPRPLPALAAELGLPPLPPQFQDGLDAAFAATDGTVHLFKGRAHLAGGEVTPLAGVWGKNGNAFESGALDAAFTGRGGELYAFRGGQYVRYPATGALDIAELGYPRTIADDWGDLPPDFEAGIDGAFTLDGRVYLTKGDRYVRYSGPGRVVDRTFPQAFAHRWTGGADYRLGDVHVIAGFAELCRTRPDGLAAFLLAGAEDPYAHLADRFGWPLEEVRWARRNIALLRPDTREEDLFEIEFLLSLASLFTVTTRIGSGPAELYEKVWARLHGPARDQDAAAAALGDILRRRSAPAEWKIVSARLRDRLNTRRRDALVAALTPVHGKSRDLYEKYLIDVDMGPAGTTSRIREAIAATQLYVQRYLLDLERADLPAGVDPAQVKARLRTWWKWMRTYRVWEANRKVFLYPENYLRPELRDRKTPAFQALQDDLLQREITAATVQGAYKRYLDEYTEVSRLTIAGGYVYPAEGAASGVRRLVLFGRTRTDPRRYYYRTAEFREGDRLSATWRPWLKVDTQITADRVDPVHAFGRVFVFWPVVSAVPKEDQSKTTITTKESGGKQEVTAEPPSYQVSVYYSYLNLNGDWLPAQLLDSDVVRNGPIGGVSLYVQASRTVPGGDVHDSIVVRCDYTVGTGAAAVPVTAAFSLTPELTSQPATKTIAPPRPVDLSRVFAEPAPIDPAGVVRFNAPAESQDGPWCSVDHKGGSFLVRPVDAPSDAPQVLPYKGNPDRLPTTWNQVDAGFQLPDGTLYVFDSASGLYVQAGPGRPASGQVRQKTYDRFGYAATNLGTSAAVDAVLIRGDKVFLFCGDEYYRYQDYLFGANLLEAGYPKKLAANTENLPRWDKVDVAFAAPDGTEVFYSRALDGYVTSGSLTSVKPVAANWRLPARTQITRAVVSGGRAHVVGDGQYVRLRADLTAEAGYPKPLPGNKDGVPEQEPTGPSLTLGGGVFTFDNARGTLSARGGGQDEAPRQTWELGRAANAFTTEGKITAAYVSDGKLFLVGAQQYVRYTLASDGTVPRFVDAGYPRPVAQPLNGVITRGDQRYLISTAGYAPVGRDFEPGTAVPLLSYTANWRGLPAGFPADLTGAMSTDSALFLFLRSGYVTSPTADATARPYETATLPIEIVRLTSSTAAELNRRLLTGGVDALLAQPTQELDELPSFSPTTSDATTVQVKPKVAAHVPVSTHLDFDSANGLYYWEIFHHAPMLIAQALNEAQRFEDARHWYEFVFDPTRHGRPWRFLPFLAVDPGALVAACRLDLTELGDATLTARLTPVLAALDPMVPAFRRARDLTAAERDRLTDLAGTGLDPVKEALAAVPQDARTAELAERIALIGQLRRQYDLMGDRRALLQTYLDDPFDPHAIAELRPDGYRRGVVMAYIDNLLDWGDMLFRQYTAESVDEARLLYIFAYDLLGRRPATLGTGLLPPAAPYELTDGDGPGETAHLTADGTLLKGGGIVHAGVANPYFHVPGNAQFLEYWTRVEDRLTKIRASLDILGISRPLPLFDPPLDVMALVRGAAAGLSADQVTAALAAPIPAYRFDVVLARAKELAARVRELGSALLDAIERRDGEELGLLQNRQDAELHALTRQIKEQQIKIAEEGLAEARAAKAGADARVKHYTRLIADGMSPLQIAQLVMMGLGATGQFVSGGLKIGAAIAKAVPQIHAGPFIFGTTTGGESVGGALSEAAEISASLGEGFSMVGELLGVIAEFEGQKQDWDLQLATGRAEADQLGHQIAGAELQVAVARRDLEIHLREAAHLEAVKTFLTTKFAGSELYGWMVGQISGLYFQTYQLAFDMARAAERAFEAERGRAPGLIRPTYWDSRRKGLLAGDQLGLDLERLDSAYAEAGARGMEITKRVSLLRLDAAALLAFQTEGRCEFALSEDLFDRDFPGHYRRQIKSISVAFATAEGPVQLNATLTQLSDKTVLTPDPKAVGYLLDPRGAPPASLRSAWRPGQRIALSEVTEGEDAGLFEVRYDDPRYLPFEGSGAVSRWRLETRRPPSGLRDVTITVRYSAEDGGETFATAVRGLLKPYPAAVALDVAAVFPDEWQDLRTDETGELRLRVTPDLLPGISGRQITGITALYGPGSTARLLLDGDARQTLVEGQLLRPAGLTAGSAPWRLTLSGSAEDLTGLTLILLYRATA
ncbi:hemopexin repeat-containing protein [Actinomadura macrotermitis]|uniref:Hemopexin n=1 Tax=Actinomadura macrotermitis TaxID=2585200 RepID=A0A7K0C620_9ACTN|nr:hemopexin repeat-containing protein [Actinomadura macrotermitis]MQY08900.1 hypothetical protein [Actinomadura macrotermitis]